MSKELSNDDKARLATELCGGTLLRPWPAEISTWHFPPNSDGLAERVHESDFDPVNNGSHTMLVLEGLAKEALIENHYRDLAWEDAWDRIWSKMKEVDFHFASAVCTAGLEVIGKGGGR